MRYAIALLCLAAAAQTQTASLSPAGKWVSNLKFFAEDNYDRLELNLSGTTLTGKLGNDAFDGTFQNGRIEGAVKPNPHRTIQLRGRLNGDRIEGTATMVEDRLATSNGRRNANPARLPPRPKLTRSSPRSSTTSSLALSNRPFTSVPATR
jgi:hypothetical protein